MTLLVRLLAALCFGAIIALVSYKLLWPQPQFTGEYTATGKQGSYILRLDEDLNAVMIFTDQKKKRFAYKGRLKPGKNIAITWEAQRKGEDWIPLKASVLDRIIFKDKNTLVATEGTFTRSK